MTFIDKSRMDACFRIMESIVTTGINYQSGDPSCLSFHSGELYRREGYKYDIARGGHEIMAAVPWTQPDIIGSGKISMAAHQAVNFIPEGWNRQENLVDWSDMTIIMDLSTAKRRALEIALLKLFTSDDDEGAFNALVAALGQKYALITYFFFLKDSTRFAVMRPIRFAERFGLIGAPTTCASRCTWKNYQEFNAILGEVRDYLTDLIDDPVTLLDAHSYVWSLYIVADYRKAGGVEIPDAPDGESYVAIEGKRIAYYTSKYERKPRIRNEAIRIHGYRCAACGFSYVEKYGELGRFFIEVHHIKPLFSLEDEVEVNPETDLVCLCANCHRMIHRRKNTILTVEELQRILHRWVGDSQCTS